MNLIIKGVILGFIIVLPGMSGGTVFLIFGIYEKMIKDILEFKIRPYIPLVTGMILGIFMGGFTFTLFFENYRDITVAFLLGCLLASVKPVLKECPEIKKKRIIMMLLGIVVGWVMVAEPLGVDIDTQDVDWWLLFIGGIFSSATMILPGIPGSSVLILLGIYDVIIFSIRELNIFNLLVFAIGSVVGIFSLLSLLGKLYDRYRGLISYFFAGLIIGSSRGLIPSVLNIWTIGLIIVGFLLVWIWSDKKTT